MKYYGFSFFAVVHFHLKVLCAIISTHVHTYMCMHVCMCAYKKYRESNRINSYFSLAAESC